jgi:hypothetical protein
MHCRRQGCLAHALNKGGHVLAHKVTKRGIRQCKHAILTNGLCAADKKGG